ncbi:hypothetical protein [Candidatus Hecatella orcuttiae]|uniref:hypothetical protein n=1 Tax=Candidatus Hecatella orcuttiae TaxID=1935119 RepID=UPI00286810D4|nr:hypothetical protein [Candidatus Hecatella orcuttiae]
MPRVFVLSKLRPEAKAEEYEKWVHEFDYPTTEKFFKSITSYRVYKLKETLEGKPLPYNYIECIDIKNVEEYKKDLSTPEALKLLRQWAKYIEGVTVFTETI